LEESTPVLHDQNASKKGREGGLDLKLQSGKGEKGGGSEKRQIYVESVSEKKRPHAYSARGKFWRVERRKYLLSTTTKKKRGRSGGHNLTFRRVGKRKERGAFTRSSHKTVREKE